MPDVILYQDQPVTRSLDVARRFHKRHGHVLRSIDALFASVGTRAQNCALVPEETEGPTATQNWALVPEETEGPTATQNWAPVPEETEGPTATQNWALVPEETEGPTTTQNWALVPEETEGRTAPQNWGTVPDELATFFRTNFLPGEYTYKSGNNVRKTSPMYYLTRDGFAYLVMGFTGKEAALWKVRFINLFNLMAEKLARSRVDSAATEADSLRQEMSWLEREMVRRTALSARQRIHEAEVDGFILGQMAVHGRHWNKERQKLVEKVILWHRAGYSYRRTAKDLGISASAVGNIVRRYSHWGSRLFTWDAVEDVADRLETHENWVRYIRKEPSHD